MIRLLILAACLVSLPAFAAPTPVSAKVVVVAHDSGYYTSLAKHIKRWLASEEIEAKLVNADEMHSALAAARMAFLVGFNEPSAAEMRILRDYRARNGMLVVFYSASPALAALMGVKPLGYAKAAYPGQWSRIDFKVDFPYGLPRSILQTSTVLQRAVPLPGKGRVMAVWSDRTGKSTGEAAWISTAGGYWMTHVLSADGDEVLEAQLLAAMVGCIEPSLWNHRQSEAKKARARAALRQYALKQIPRKGEIHAVWDHSGCGLYPGNWPKTIKVLRESRVTDLFVNVAGAGFAHYPSAILPPSRTFEQEGDQLKACLEAARGSGIRVHAWILCFNATRAAPGRLDELKKRGWRLKRRSDGMLTEYLDPSNGAVRRNMLDAIDEIRRKYRLDGIHLDFVRWYEQANRPANAAEVITRFVAEARRHVPQPLWLTAAVLGKYPSCVGSVGQDWASWLDANLVDYVMPMDYTEDPTRFESYLRQHAAVKAHARKTIVGIGVTANESRLGAREVIDQINLARKYGVPGVSLFDLDVTLEKQILPYLRLGQW